MEVKPGYKRTEVGTIPEDWAVSTVGTEFSIQLGKMLDAEKNVGVPKPFLGNRAVQWGRIDLTDIGEIKLTPSDLQRFRLCEGDLLACEGGEIGRAAVWRQPIDECYYQKALHRLRPIRGYNVQLMLNMMHRLASTGLLQNFVTQTSIAHLPKDKFETVPIALPPTQAEQEAIAEALSDVDALIESLEQLLAKKRQLKQGAMQELLTGKKRLPGFDGRNPLTRTEIGTFPADWVLIPLRGLIDPNRGIRYGIVQPGKYDPRGRYMIRGQDYSEAKGWAKPSDVFRVGDAIEQRYRNARVKTGDLIMTIVGYCGHVEMVPDWLHGANLTQTTARIAIHEDRAVGAYCKYVLQSDIGKKQVATHVKGAAQPGLNCGDVEYFVVSLPPTLAEQSAIATVLSDIEVEIATLEAKLAKARSIKQGMMHELLTGRIRLV